MFAQKLTTFIKVFSEEIQHDPVIVYGSFYEASIRSKIQCDVKFAKSTDEKHLMLKEILDFETKFLSKRIVIFCSNDIECQEASNCVQAMGYRHFVFYTNTAHYKFRQASQRILIIVDENLKFIGSYFSSSESYSNYCFIHYTIPNVLDEEFDMRFKFSHEHNDSNIKFKTYLLMGKDNKEQAHYIVHLLERMNIKIPKDLVELKNSMQLPICNSFVAFGKCPLESRYCLDRHKFTIDEVPNPNLPSNGLVKLNVTHILTANKIYAQIIGYKDVNSDGKLWQKFSPSIGDFYDELLKLKECDEGVDIVKEGSLYGIAVRETIHRVKITSILGDEVLDHYQITDDAKVGKILKVFHLDYGYISQCTTHNLIELPKNLKAIPQLAHECYIWGIKPKDSELEWEYTSTRRLFEFFAPSSVIYSTAWVKLQINGIFWLDNMKIYQRLKYLKTEINSVHPASTLISEKFADVNKRNLPGFNTDRDDTISKSKMGPSF